MMRVGVYVQVPFCQTKCTYCNFHTGVVSSARFAPYVEAVCREIREHRELLEAARVDWPGRLGRSSSLAAARDKAAPLQGRGETPSEDLVVDTVYIGGGTPSLLESMHLQSILDAIRSTFRLNLEAEGASEKKSGVEPPHSKTPACPQSAGQAPGGR